MILDALYIYLHAYLSCRQETTTPEIVTGHLESMQLKCAKSVLQIPFKIIIDYWALPLMHMEGWTSMGGEEDGQAREQIPRMNAVCTYIHGRKHANKEKDGAQWQKT